MLTDARQLIDLLKRMSIIPQMIIVTHDSDLEEAADTILRVKERGIIHSGILNLFLLFNSFIFILM